MGDEREHWEQAHVLDEDANEVRREYWRAFRKAEKELMVVAGPYGALVSSMRRHAQHCRRHPHDTLAATRLASLVGRCEEARNVVATLSGSCRRAKTSYLKRVLILLRVPADYLPDAPMDIVRSDGSVRIGNKEWNRYWVLDAEGVLHRCTR